MERRVGVDRRRIVSVCLFPGSEARHTVLASAQNVPVVPGVGILTLLEAWG